LKTVLILAANFPPAGGVGVIRTVKFIKYLPDFGWNSIVVTLPQMATKRIIDSSLLSEIPPETEIHRPFFYDYRKVIGGDIAKLLGPILNRIHFPDKYVQWNYFAFKYIRDRILPHKKIDLIYTSVGPHSTMLLAHRLKQQFKIPFFLDFRDPFSFSQYNLLDGKTTLQSRAENIERAVFKAADHISNVSRIWQEKYERLYPGIVTKSSLIHNGYDEDDFRDLNTAAKNDMFTLGYNGTFSRIVPLDPILSAISAIHREQGIPIRMNIATPIKKRKLASKYPYLFENDLIEYKGFLPHRESLQNLCRSDLALLILNDLAATEGMIPAKTFEYMRIAKPILLLHRKNGFLSELIDKTNTGMTINIGRHKQIVKSLLTLHQKWAEDRLKCDPDWAEIKKFDRKNLTNQLAHLFDRLV
jgi:glycosyltransferase involved in cell wall biosynthesis